MIDFISTHPGADPQTIACARLLASVIAQAIDDASNRACSAHETASAINWLYEEGTCFEDYARLIGADAASIRRALLEPTSGKEPRGTKYDAMKRRYLRMQHADWLERKAEREKILKGVAA